MHVEYGSYKHAAQEIELTVTRETLETDARTPWAVQERWDMVGQLVGTSSADINSKLRRLQAAYAVNDRKLRVVFDSGAETHLVLNPSNTIGGVRVVKPPDLPAMRQAAYVTFLNYTIGVEAIVPIDDPETLLRSFRERVVREGGGPRFGHLEPLNAPPIKQQLKQYTIFRATQQGFAVRLYGGYPTPPRPLWPVAQMKAPVIEQTGPEWIGGTPVNFGVSWTYEFEAGVPLLGSPHIWGAV